jgi:hypothetical protein
MGTFVPLQATVYDVISAKIYYKNLVLAFLLSLMDI